MHTDQLRQKDFITALSQQPSSDPDFFHGQSFQNTQNVPGSLPSPNEHQSSDIQNNEDYKRIWEQQLNIQQLQQLQQLQQQIFQQQARPPVSSSHNQRLSNSAPANVSFQMTSMATEVDSDVSPLTSPWLGAYTQQPPGLIVFNKRSSFPSVDVDFDVSPLTSPWLGAYTQQPPGLIVSNKRSAFPSVDVDFDVSPLTSPWLGAHTQQPPGLVVSNKRSTSPSVDVDFDVSPLTSPWLGACTQQPPASVVSNKRSASPSDEYSTTRPVPSEPERENPSHTSRFQCSQNTQRLHTSQIQVEATEDEDAYSEQERGGHHGRSFCRDTGSPHTESTPPASRDFTGPSTKQLDSVVSQPSTVYTASDSSIIIDPESSACRRLINHAFSPREVISLIEVIFRSKAEINIVRDLRGDDAQTFIDVIHGALDSPDLPPRLWKKCLGTLCKICGRQALLPRSIRIPPCYNRLDNPRYHGGYADVWKGEYQGCHVAVKILRVYSTSDFDKITRRFCKEVVTWKALNHPNVLPLLGITMDNHRFAMVSEWMTNGNINEYIRANRYTNRFELLQGVAKGLTYMHDQALIHGDLKGANILIDRNGLARLADFGLVTVVSDPTIFTASSSAIARGTIRWMSPELLDPDQFESCDGQPTKESDCYALGMVIYEVLSGKAPFMPLKVFIVMRKVLEGQRPRIPEGVEGTWFTEDLWRTLKLCWATQPGSRPTIEAVLGCLEQVSGTWQPPSPHVPDEEIEKDDSDWDTTETDVLRLARERRL